MDHHLIPIIDNKNDYERRVLVHIGSRIEHLLKTQNAYIMFYKMLYRTKLMGDKSILDLLKLVKL